MFNVKTTDDDKTIRQIIVEGRFDKINKTHLNNKYLLKWTDNAYYLGSCNVINKIIRISCIDDDIDQCLDTINHELAHACAYEHDNAKGHDKKWKAWAIELDAKPVARRSQSNTMKDHKAKWMLQHIETGKIYRTFRRRPKRQIKEGMYIKTDKKGTLNKLEIVEIS